MKYRVKLSEEERESLRKKISSGTSPARELLHAQVLLKIDQGGDLRLTNKAAAAEVGIASRSVQRIRQRYALEGVDAAIARKDQPPRPEKRKITYDVEAKLIALACSAAPEGRQRWTLRLLADKAVELELFVGKLSHQSVRKVLKKSNFDLTESSGG